METICKTKIAEFSRHVFTINKMVKSYSRYEIADIFSSNLLNPVIKIQTIYNDYDLSDVKKHLSFKSMTEWNISINKIILFPSEVQGVYFGKFINEHVKSLLIARFMADNIGMDNCPEQKLIIDIFPDYYPSDEETILDIITQ